MKGANYQIKPTNRKSSLFV